MTGAWVGRDVRSLRRLAAGVTAAVLAAAAAAVASAPAAQAATAFDPHLTRAPYLTDLVALHVNVNWATDQSATTGTMQWGPVTGGARTPANHHPPPRHPAF